MSSKKHHDESNIWDILHIVFVVVFILSVLGAGGYAYYYFFYKDKEETVTIPSFIAFFTPLPTPSSDPYIAAVSINLVPSFIEEKIISDISDVI